MKRRESGKRLASRLTGISGPGFGISWTPATADADVAHRVIAFLEDRRALYEPYIFEVETHVIESVIEIRRFLTDVIGAAGISKSLSGSLRVMRGACREFLHVTGFVDDRGQPISRSYIENPYNHVEMERFNQALGKLRGLMGVQLALIASQYGLEVEDELSTIMPPPAD